MRPHVDPGMVVCIAVTHETRLLRPRSTSVPLIRGHAHLTAPQACADDEREPWTDGPQAELHLLAPRRPRTEDDPGENHEHRNSDEGIETFVDGDSDDGEQGARRAR